MYRQRLTLHLALRLLEIFLLSPFLPFYVLFPHPLHSASDSIPSQNSSEPRATSLSPTLSSPRLEKVPDDPAQPDARWGHDLVSLGIGRT